MLAERRLLQLGLAALVAASACGYAVVAHGGWQGGPYVLGHLLLTAAMVAGYRLARGLGEAARPWIVAGAILFRAAALAGEPALSDDLYRYLWDGRVQAAGIHPYRHAPLDEALEPLRDDQVWPRINHPELPTIYPPHAQAFFALLALSGAGVLGFRLAFVGLDLVLVWSLHLALRRAGAPQERLVLYAWNPLAVVEIAGSGHLEPLGVLPLVFAALAASHSRHIAAGAALGVASGAKLAPGVLLPSLVRRCGRGALLAWVLAVGALALPYAVWGDAVGAGLWAYAARWERNGLVYGALRALFEACDSGRSLGAALAALEAGAPWLPLPWGWLYEAVWPTRLARLSAGGAAVLWIGWLAWRGPRSIWREWRLALGGLVLCSPTVHPWYWLWVLPFAARDASVFWLGLAALAPLAYLSAGEVPWNVRALEYGLPLAWLAWNRAYRRDGGV